MIVARNVAPVSLRLDECYAARVAPLSSLMTKLRALAFFAFVLLFLGGLSLLDGRTDAESETQQTKRHGNKARPKKPGAISRSVLLLSGDVRRARKAMVEKSDAERIRGAATMIAAQLQLGRALANACSAQGAPIPRFASVFDSKHEHVRAEVLRVLPEFSKDELRKDPKAEKNAQRLLKRLRATPDTSIKDVCGMLESEPEKYMADLLPPNLFPRAHHALMERK